MILISDFGSVVRLSRAPLPVMFVGPHTLALQKSLGLSSEKLASTHALLEQDATPPFIVRYRSHLTGNLTEADVVSLIRARADDQRLEQRRQHVLQELDRSDLAADEHTRQVVLTADNFDLLEDVHQRVKPPPPVGRVVAAREAGYSALAERVWNEPLSDGAIRACIAGLRKPASEVADGVCCLLANNVSQRVEVRRALRELFWNTARVQVAAASKSKQGAKAATSKVATPRHAQVDPSSLVGMDCRVAGMRYHRVLAMNRAEVEGSVSVSVQLPTQAALPLIRRKAFPGGPGGGERARLLLRAVEEAYSRQLRPAMVRAVRAQLSKEAHEAAADVFARNLRRLLLQRPLRGVVILGVDPGYTHGCKLAVVDVTGKVLQGGAVYPHAPRSEREAARHILREMCHRHQVGVIAIGNGTASRETQEFVAAVLQSDRVLDSVKLSVVNEAGASVLSVSAEAIANEPNLDHATRGAASLARRLQDPLAELVRIEPSSIGVGMYQHDVKPKQLEAELDRAVQSAVCEVGVDLDTASTALLTHLPGLTRARAVSIVSGRPSGGFTSRADLLRIKGIGPRSYEQAVGFLRVNGPEPLDATAVHPESYTVARALLKELGVAKAALGSHTAKAALERLLASDDALADVSARLGAPQKQLQCIASALASAGREPREALEPPLLLGSHLRQLADVRVGERLAGVVRNVVPFGAFVDVGLGHDGLVHRSQMPGCGGDGATEAGSLDELTVGQRVNARVLAVDLPKKRLSLSLKMDTGIGKAAEVASGASFGVSHAKGKRKRGGGHGGRVEAEAEPPRAKRVVQVDLT